MRMTRTGDEDEDAYSESSLILPFTKKRIDSGRGGECDSDLDDQSQQHHHHEEMKTMTKTSGAAADDDIKLNADATAEKKLVIDDDTSSDDDDIPPPHERAPIASSHSTDRNVVFHVQPLKDDDL